MSDEAARAAIDALVSRFFSAFDNRDGKRPQVAEISDCFTDKATVVRRSDAATEVMTVGEFAAPRIELLARGTLVDFHEWETSAATEVFDDIATRTSRYAKSGLLDGRAYGGAGSKCFQLALLDAGWRITALAWIDDPVAG